MVWRTPEQLVTLAFSRARFVMMNEGHSGLARCVRTRRVGRAILPAAHAAGCRYLAMEAITSLEPGPSFTTVADPTNSYFDQPEMFELATAALELGWQLVGYECYVSEEQAPDLKSIEFVNLRERQQAENLAAAIDRMPRDAGLLVWCGNSHHRKSAGAKWIPMGVQFAALGRYAYAIDQLATVAFDADHPPPIPLTPELRAVLENLGGTAGFNRDEPPAGFAVGDGWDARILSTDNVID
jgi:hypothetical protein